MTITEKDLDKHRQLMTDFIYSMAVAQLLDVKTDVDKVLQDFRENQHLLLKKYGYIPTHKYYIDFNGEIHSLA